MKNLQKYWSASLLVRLSIITALAFLCLTMNSPRTQTSAAAPSVSSNTSSGISEEGSATLSPANLNTWGHVYEWYSPLPHCDRPLIVGVALEDIAGSIVAGFKHRYDKGAVILGCPDGSNTVFRGTVWFDLSDIISKAPPLHVAVKSATLHFKNLSGECPGELLVGTADWMKGYAENALVPGDPLPLARLGSCGSEGCSIDVQTVVNNWVRGAEHGGYANYGFVFKGIAEADLKYGDNDSCLARYGDFSLTVTYKYDKAPPVIYSPLPDRPVIMVAPEITRKNVALAANGATATASSIHKIPSYSPDRAIDGEHKGLNWSKGGGWVGAGPTNNDWLQVDFSGSKTINEIDVFMVQDDLLRPIEPDLSTPFAKYGLVDFTVQYWSRFGAWMDVPVAGNPVTGNMKVLKKFTFPDLKTSKIRVLVSKTPDGYSRLTEVEAWAK